MTTRKKTSNPSGLKRNPDATQSAKQAPPKKKPAPGRKPLPEEAGPSVMARIIGVSRQALDFHITNGLLKEGVDFKRNERGHRVFFVKQVRATLRENTNPHTRFSELGDDATIATSRPPTPDQDVEESPDIAGGLTINDLKRRNLALKNEKEQLEVDRMKGELVERVAVDKALYEFGAIIRSEMMAIPARVVDSMLAADDRPSAALILSDAIENALKQLVKIGKIKYD